MQEHYGTPLGGRVRALDYLDKVFHVPFAVRPMNERGGEYLRSLLPEPWARTVARCSFESCALFGDEPPP